MSIYSGFPTRKDETNYNQLLAKLLKLMQAHIIQLLSPNKVNNSKVFAYARVISKMQQYEQHKYLPPKFSQLLQPLANLIGLPTKVDFLSSEGNSGFDSAKQKLKSFNSQKEGRAIVSNSKGAQEIKESQVTAFRFNQQRDVFTQSKPKTRKSTYNSQSIKKQHKFHASFYDIHQKKLNQMHERYNSRAKYINQRIAEQQNEQRNYRPHSESPMGASKHITSTKYDPANKYGIIHMKGLREAQQQVRNFKNSTPKTRVRTQFI